MIAKVPSESKDFMILIEKWWEEKLEYVGWAPVIENVGERFISIYLIGWFIGYCNKPKYGMLKDWPWVEAEEIGG